MANLFEEINNLDHWDYYENVAQIPIDKWDSQSDHISFIEKFLDSSGKTQIIDFFGISLSNFERAIHTNSVFFIGSLLYKKLEFEDNIDFRRSDDRDEFRFVWFLSSLMHDFGYDLEDKKDIYKNINNNIESFIKEFNLDEKLLKQPIDRYSENMKKLITYIPEYFKRRFDGQEGRDRNGKIDHGIASGLILYNGLVKNRKNKQQDHNLYWGDELDNFYAVAAYSVAIHNIRYKDDTVKFSINSDPFLFLFWLADTIEPTKFFDNCKPAYVLQNIIIHFHENKKGFNIKNKHDSQLNFISYQKRIKGLTKFLDIKINTVEENNIIVSW